MSQPQFTYDQVKHIADLLSSKSSFAPKIGIICGTGLGGLADTLTEKTFVDYEDIPDFPVSTVTGHASRFVFGILGDKPVLCMQGRFHMYEGYTMDQLTLPIRVMKLMGIQMLIVTNAAGSVNPSFKAGDLMILKDHIFFPNFSGRNPLVGANDERYGPRFPAMSDVYCRELRKIARDIAVTQNIDSFMREGVYVMFAGPSFETVAECRMLRALGGDVIGMSTCPEVTVAAHCGIRVFALSMISNECVMDYDDTRVANHEEVLETGNSRKHQVQQFVTEIVRQVPSTLLDGSTLG